MNMEERRLRTSIRIIENAIHVNKAGIKILKQQLDLMNMWLESLETREAESTFVEEGRLRTSILIIENAIHVNKDSVKILKQQLDLMKAWLELLEIREEESTR